jgi:SAM-dependent methyltransferase
MKKIKAFYNICWQGYLEKEYAEATELLFKRFVLNRVPFSLVEGKACLDIGCGHGRYSKALVDFGASHVTGVDLNIPDFKHGKFSFKKGSILELPFEDNEFEFVFCNGVLHHTVNWRKGLCEAVRVLKPNGWLWFYSVGNNKVWRLGEKIRKKMIRHKGLDSDIKEYLLLRGWETGKIFFLLDSFFPPHNDLCSRKEIEDELRLNGLVNIRYLEKYVEDVLPETHLRFVARKNE